MRRRGHGHPWEEEMADLEAVEAPAVVAPEETHQVTPSMDIVTWTQTPPRWTRPMLWTAWRSGEWWTWWVDITERSVTGSGCFYVGSMLDPLLFINTLCTTVCQDKTWHQPARFEKSWPPFCQIWIIFTHLKLWIASARHNFKWVKIQIE